MTDETSAPAGGDDTLVATAPADVTELSAEDAGRALAELRWKRANPEQAPAAEKPAVETPNESPEREDAARPEGDDPGEEPEAVEPEEEKLPPIERPRSWSKDDDDDWNALPRHRQEKIAANELAREKDIRQRINEAAEVRKAAEAKLSQLDRVVQSYKETDDGYERESMEKFPNIKSQEDLTFLRNQAAQAANSGDHALYAQIAAYLESWKDHNEKWAGIRARRIEAENLRASERQSKWAQFVNEESNAFADETPEFKAKEVEYGKKAGDVLRELGYSDAELAKLVSGEEKIALFDRRMQRLLFDRIRLSEIKAAPLKAVPKAIPKVERPGSPPPKGERVSERIQALEKQFDREPTAENATALRLARLRRG